MTNIVQSIKTADGHESKHNAVLDSKWVEKNAETSKLLALRSLSGNYCKNAVATPAGSSSVSIASASAGQGAAAGKIISVTTTLSGNNTPEMYISPRAPIQVKNEIRPNATAAAIGNKMVNRFGEDALRVCREAESPRSFNLAEQLKKINGGASNASSTASGTVAVSTINKSGSASCIMMSRDIAGTAQVKRIDSSRIIRRGYSDDIPSMIKKSGNRLVKSQSNNSARFNRTPAEYGHVYLNIYDLEAVNRVVNVVAGTFGAGAYHAGVEIYGHEYNFGYTPQGGTGVVQSYPRYHAAHKYRRSIDLGRTKYSPREVLEIVERLKPLWLGTSYDILKRNCLNFADTLCKELGVGGMPSWVMGLQNKINWTRDSFQSGAAKLKKLIDVQQIDEAVGISRAFGSLSRKLTGECTRGNI